jgi:hypothetical protein
MTLLTRLLFMEIHRLKIKRIRAAKDPVYLKCRMTYKDIINIKNNIYNQKMVLIDVNLE